MSNIDWNKAPSWAVDVRRTPDTDILVWTNGKDRHEPIDRSFGQIFSANGRFKFWPAVEVRPNPIGYSVPIKIDQNGNAEALEDGAPVYSQQQGRALRRKTRPFIELVTVGPHNVDILIDGKNLTERVEGAQVIIEREEFIENVPLQFNGTIPKDQFDKFLKSNPDYDVKRLASLITSWPLTVQGAEALAKANIVSRIDARWCGSKLQQIILDGVTEDEWLDAVTLSEQDMLQLSGREDKKQFVSRADDCWRQANSGVSGSEARAVMGTLYDYGCRFIKTGSDE